MGACLGGNYIENKKHFESIKITIRNHMVIIEDKIAGGAFGDIWKCRDIKSGRLYALKQIRFYDEQTKQSYERESRWLKKLQNVDGVVSMITTASKYIKSEEIQVGFILMQFCEINLLDQLRIYRFRPSEILGIMREITTTLKEIHKLKCIHLDIKLQNILWGRKFNTNLYKLCDFGSSLRLPLRDVSFLNQTQKRQVQHYFQQNSTFNYRAPEIIHIGTQSLTEKIDIWMLGCVIYFLLFRKHPFGDSGVTNIEELSFDFVGKNQILSNYEENCRKFILRCLKNMLKWDQNERMSAEQIVNIITEEEQTNF